MHKTRHRFDSIFATETHPSSPGPDPLAKLNDANIVSKNIQDKRIKVASFVA